MSNIYSLTVAFPGKDGKTRNRELGIATVNKDASLTLHFDLALPIDPATGYPAKVFLRKIKTKQEPAPVQQELELASS